MEDNDVKRELQISSYTVDGKDPRVILEINLPSQGGTTVMIEGEEYLAEIRDAINKVLE